MNIELKISTYFGIALISYLVGRLSGYRKGFKERICSPKSSTKNITNTK